MTLNLDNPWHLKSWCYDIETILNCFTVQFIHVVYGWVKRFEVSEWQDDRPALVAWLDQLQAAQHRLVGFNSLGFDYPILHAIHESRGDGMSVAGIYAKAQSIIHAQDRYSSGVAPWLVRIPQLDLFKVHHFNNKAKSTSLKALEFNMRVQNVAEMPIRFDVPMRADQRAELDAYNFNDIVATLKFYWLSQKAIDMRDRLTALTGRDHANLDDTGIGKKLLVAELERAVPGICHNGREARQTHRNTVPLRDIIFPYIRFTYPDFARVHAYLMTQEVNAYDVRGFFSRKRREAEGEEPTISATLNGFQFDFGAGGIHGSVKRRTYRENDTHCIVDLDVKGYYPEIGIQNRLSPAHLPTDLFVSTLQYLKGERAKHAKGTDENQAYKLGMNGSIGDSANLYSCFLDVAYNLAITINGQLLLCMLAEALAPIPGLEIIQANTDGMTLWLPRAGLEHVRTVYHWWEKFACLEVEENHYGMMAIRDVNCYIAADTSGKVKKRKNALSWVVGPNLGAGELAWHQDHSCLVVPMAAEVYMIRGVPIEQYIRGHRDIFDFCSRAKADRSQRLELGDASPVNVGKLLRYYVSTDGQPLYVVLQPPAGCKLGEFKRKPKVSESLWATVRREIPPGTWDARIHTGNRSVHKETRKGIEAGFKVRPCNHIADARWDNIDYDYYINATRALVDSVGFHGSALYDEPIPF